MKIILTILLIFIPGICLSGPLTLAWDANSDGDLSGYRLYQTEWTGQHTLPWVMVKDIAGDQTTAIIDIDLSKNYIWYITAYDTSGNESQASNIAVLKDNTAPNTVDNLKKR